MNYLKLIIFLIIFAILVYFIGMVNDLFIQALLFISSFLFICIAYVFTGDVFEAMDVVKELYVAHGFTNFAVGNPLYSEDNKMVNF